MSKIIDLSQTQQQRQPQYLFKVIIIGDTNTGKTTICNTLMNRLNPTMQYQPTIGIDFNSNIETLYKSDTHQTNVKIHLWDTAGQEKYRSIVNSYYRNTCGTIITYDITNESTFRHIDNWLAELRKHNNCRHHYSHPILLLGTKSDLEYRRRVSYAEGQKLAQRNNLFFREIVSFNKNGGLYDGYLEFLREIYNLSEDERKHYIQSIPTAIPISNRLVINCNTDSKISEETMKDITENLCKGIKYTGLEPLIIDRHHKSKFAVINQSDHDDFSPTRNCTKCYN